MMKNRILDRCLPLHLILKRLLTFLLIVVAHVDSLILIDGTTLFWNARPVDDLHTHNIVLVELLCPSLRYPVFDLVLDHRLVRAFGQCLRQRLLV